MSLVALLMELQHSPATCVTNILQETAVPEHIPDLPAVKVGGNSSNGGAIRSGTNFIPCRYSAGEDFKGDKESGLLVHSIIK